MSQIDFLPDYFHRELAQRRSTVRGSILLVVAALCMGGWYMQFRHRDADLKRYQKVLEQDQVVAAMRQQQFDLLVAQRGEAEEKVRVLRELKQPIELHRILATLSAIAPKPIALSGLSLRQHRPRVRMPGDETSNRTPPKPGSIDLEIGIEGFAPSGAAIAELIGALEKHPLFSHIKMTDNRPTRKANLVARQFRIKMRIPMDRAYRIERPQAADGATPEAGTEVAHAG
ncbi:MAG: hypothetical protein CMJ18_01845 [Phycisphaeraceae bacterium]|nr:hypothetical protein [Phycisphaeraceae bacterium]